MSCAYIGYCRENGHGRWEVKPDGWSAVMIEQHREDAKAAVAKYGAPTRVPKELREAARRERERRGIK